MNVRIRTATTDDLAACQAIWAGPPSPRPAPEPNPLHRHELETGTLLVAELDRPAPGDERPRVVGFGGALTRGGRWYLADLFVEADDRSSGVGHRLLEALAADAPTERCCAASEDLRGQALYVRAGMVPRWPIYELRAALPLPHRLPVPRLRAEPAAPDDPGLAGFDEELVGVDRRVDLAWLCGPAGAEALWLIDETAPGRATPSYSPRTARCSIPPGGARPPWWVSVCAGPGWPPMP
jgi:GNAT superfamily N-acetyltransferase